MGAGRFVFLLLILVSFVTVPFVPSFVNDYGYGYNIRSGVFLPVGGVCPANDRTTHEEGEVTSSIQSAKSAMVNRVSGR